MDRVFSARIDETVLAELERVTRRLGITKKQFLEEAIRVSAAKSSGSEQDVWEETCGVWQRREPPASTARRARKAFELAMHRHHR